MPKRNTKDQSMRDKAEKARSSKGASPKKHIKKSASNVSGYLKIAHEFGKKEYHLPMPDNRLGGLLSKRGRILPKYFKESWAELKQVTWPSKEETIRLTVAVFIFSIVFGGLVALLDMGLDKIFRGLIIK